MSGYGLRIEMVREAKEWDGDTDTETDKPASLEEKFEFLLDVLMEKEQQLDDLEDELDEFKGTVWNHRHRVENGLYSEKASR